MESNVIKEAVRLDGGMVKEELLALQVIAGKFVEGSTITNVGCFRGSSCIIFLNAMKGKKATFNLIDCFDIPGISLMSCQSCLGIPEFMSYIEPWIDRVNHKVNVIRANTLEMSEFPESDYMFLDAGHTKECITNDVKLAKKAWTGNGFLMFHDYNQPSWADVTVVIDANFDNLEIHRTLAVYYGD